MYIAELMVENNVILEAVTVLSNLNTTIRVTDKNGLHTVTTQQPELVAECLIVGNLSTCKCSPGYIWSNDVCYNTTTCCSETSCNKNVTHFTPLCIPKAQVHINGSVVLSTPILDSVEISNQLLNAFKQLNGFEHLNVTGQREDNTIADFEADVSVFFETSRLQTLLDQLESDIRGEILVDIFGQ
ncbi:hypothetical protein LDENG_00255010 [Lucifuga dentata]|nr:hypothetical protein LDENG_00255010 [Lucifuga dentata]